MRWRLARTRRPVVNLGAYVNKAGISIIPAFSFIYSSSHYVLPLEKPNRSRYQQVEAHIFIAAVSISHIG